MKKILFVIICLVFIVGCSSDKADDGLVTYMEAKEMIINEGAILIDVRTEQEYNEGHIGGAVLLTLDTINEKTAEEVIEGKNNTVILYCRSGNRSSQAMTLLNNLGYTNVYDLGAMSNWEE